MKNTLLVIVVLVLMAGCQTTKTNPDPATQVVGAGGDVLFWGFLFGWW